VQRVMKKHAIHSTQLGRYIGEHERSVRRFLTTKKEVDIDTMEWYLEGLSELTGESLNLQTIIEKRNLWNRIKKEAIANHLQLKD